MQTGFVSFRRPLAIFTASWYSNRRFAIRRISLCNFRLHTTTSTSAILDRSLSFYKEALGLTESSRINAPDGSFIIVYLTDGVTPHLLELTWLRDWDKPYNLGDNEFHLAFRVDDFDAAHAKHKEMDCICFENPAMGIYFISDPDGYWLEVIPAK